MKLRHIYLYPDLTHFPKEITSKFRDQTRSICNYLERQVRALSFDSDGFSKVCVIGIPNPSPAITVNSSGALLIEVSFNVDEYKAIAHSALNEYFIGLLKAGFEKGEERLPRTQLLQAIEDFRASGYVNEWIAAKKTLKSLGMKASLACKLSIDAFSLRLAIERNSNLIFDSEILRTEPDEIVFESKFKAIVEKDGVVVVVDKFDDEVFSVPIGQLQ